jgi:hypothetical protein
MGPVFSIVHRKCASILIPKLSVDIQWVITQLRNTHPDSLNLSLYGHI